MSMQSRSSELVADPATTVVGGFWPFQVPSLHIYHEPKASIPDAIPEAQSSLAPQQVQLKKQPTNEQSDSYVDESAIDDDDDVDYIEESVYDQVSFKRVPPKPNLTSQRSLISLMFADNGKGPKALSNYASHSTPTIVQRARAMQTTSRNMATSPNDSDDSGLEMRRALRPVQLNPINEIPRSSARPITTSAQAQRQLSPRTTRRNMLSTELTESLRRQLLWERQQKSSTANAVLKRRHTSHDVANLKQYPEKAYMDKDKDEANASSWNQYFSREDFHGYHAQGW
ncbi:hypothetical protein F4778DRAFT_697355 [Xylariomycetidae sp. FL2044]|nr:hypothetical protein F4778DRAFT_697355 [Xylariomycetidae sp. FL2044]